MTEMRDAEKSHHMNLQCSVEMAVRQAGPALKAKLLRIPRENALPQDQS